jgi:N6-L-threonylcarbamoyladenine synthase
MLTLGIESSCDETAASVLENGRRILSNIVASQEDVHKRYGGVVPELASRRHLENISPVVKAAFSEAGIGPRDLDGVAVTQGPGLVGSLLVGINYAKALCFSLDLPLLAVHHLEGHIFSVPLTLWQESQQAEAADPERLLPALALVVSGGHTSLFWIDSLGLGVQEKASYKLLGRTRDDAAGEAFDKVAKLLGLGYPGGAVIERLARRGNPQAVKLPIPRIDNGKLDFSFSGIKTAVLRYTQKHLSRELAVRNWGGEAAVPGSILDLAASFQHTAIKILGKTLLDASDTCQPRSIMVSGGVASNRALRQHLVERFRDRGLPVFFPTPILSTDNAAMIAAAGYPKLLKRQFADLSINANRRLKLGECH